MKNISLLILSLLFTALASAAETSLEDQLKLLDTPSNQAPTSVTNERMYTVQSRYSPLDNRSEVGLGLGNTFVGDNFLNSQQVALHYRYHFNDKWNLALSGAYVSNKFDDSTYRLIQTQNVIPDVAYTKYRTDLMVSYNTFYGKFRASMDQVFYFDQYVSVGPGYVVQDSGSSPAAVADIGFAFWFGRNWGGRIGAKDFYYNEKRKLSESAENHVLGYLDVSYVFGGVN